MTSSSKIAGKDSNSKRDIAKYGGKQIPRFLFHHPVNKPDKEQDEVTSYYGNKILRENYCERK